MKGAMESIMNFMKSDERTKHIIAELEKVMDGSQEIETPVEKLVEKYVLPQNVFSIEPNVFFQSNKQFADNVVTRLVQNVPKTSEEVVQTELVHTEMLLAYHTVKREIVCILSVDIISNYVQSEFYEKWQRENNSQAGVQLVLEIEVRGELKRGIRSNESTDNIRKAFAALDPLEIHAFASSGFLSALIGCLESLPVAVSLSSASQSRLGFPLIYVNPIFEATTLFPRKEIVGQNCNFLQSADCSEKDSIERLSQALKLAKPVKVAITNIRKDGVLFHNLLVMKPIFDFKGKYAYVIGLQFDVTSDLATFDKLQYIDSMISMLPDRLPYDPND